MSSNGTPRAKVLWWIAFGCEVLITVLETFDRDYLKAASAVFLALTFLMLATGMAGEKTDKSLPRKILLFLLVAASIGLLIYRVAVGRLI